MLYQPIPEKQCYKCKTWRSVSDFYWRKERRSYSSWCRECVNARSVQSQKADPDKTRATVRRCHAKHKAQRNEYSREYGKAHREQARIREKRYAEQKRQYRVAHSELIKQRRQQWAKDNPDSIKAKKQRYRARKNALPGTLTKTEVQYCLDYWDRSCAVCGRKRGLWNSIALDHWIPVTRGGGSVVTNIVPLCQGLDGCNNSKSNSDPDEWLTRKFGKRKAKRIAERIKKYFDHVRVSSKQPEQSDS